MATVAIPGLSDASDDGAISLAPFFDLGRSWDEDVATPSPRNLYGAGIGVRWDISADLHFELYWGYAFRKIDNSDNDLQDEGIHFRLSTKVF